MNEELLTIFFFNVNIHGFVVTEAAFVYGCRFLTKGGVMILATWLSQAANEEQTSVISAALKVQRYAVTDFLIISSEVKLMQ